MIERVVVNFWGYIALKDTTGIDLLNEKLDKDGFFNINSYLLNRFDEDIAAFIYDSIISEECV